MKPKNNDPYWLDSGESVSLMELVELSGLPAADMHALVDHGVFVPVEHHGAVLSFSAHYVATARTAGRLRQDLGLDFEGLALTLTLLKRIEALEHEIRGLHAQLPRWMRS